MSLELTIYPRYFTVLRLALPRTSIKDITYKGITIPKGTVFFLNAWACNMGESNLIHLAIYPTHLTLHRPRRVD